MILTCRNCIHGRARGDLFVNCWNPDSPENRVKASVPVLMHVDTPQCEEFSDRIVNRAEVETWKDTDGE